MIIVIESYLVNVETDRKNAKNSQGQVKIYFITGGGIPAHIDQSLRR